MSYKTIIFISGFILNMEVRFYNNINFAKYKNSKYSYDDTPNNILSPVTVPDSVPYDLDLSDKKSLYDYSKNKIKDLYKYHGYLKAEYVEDYTNKIMKKLAASDVEASYTEMLLDLVKDKKLSPPVLVDFTGNVSANVAKDIDMLYSAYTEGKDAKEIFVPDFKDEKDALKHLKTGDVCRIGEDKNISIKTEEGSIKKLFISPDTYLELFPPVERFVCTQSGRFGDCYLLSSIDSMNQNPNTRYKLLEMFRENEDGTVDIAFGGFKDEDGKIVQKYPDRTILKDISSEIMKVKDDRITSFTTEGVRAIELLYEKMEENNEKESVKKRYDYFNKIKENIKSGNRVALDKNNIFWSLHGKHELEEKQRELKETKSVIIPDMVSWKALPEKELDYFCSFYEKGEKMFDVKDRWLEFTLTKEDINEKLSKVQNKDDDFSKYETLVLKRMLERFKKDSDTANFYNEILPARMMLDLFDDITSFDLLSATSGVGRGALENLGLVDTFTKKTNSDYVKEKLFAPDVSQYAFTCSSRRKDNNTKITLHNPHAYSLTPVETKDGRKFAVRNPHNTSNEVILTYEELCDYFKYIEGGRLL